MQTHAINVDSYNFVNSIEISVKRAITLPSNTAEATITITMAVVTTTVMMTFLWKWGNSIMIWWRWQCNSITTQSTHLPTWRHPHFQSHSNTLQRPVKLPPTRHCLPECQAINEACPWFTEHQQLSIRNCQMHLPEVTMEWPHPMPKCTTSNHNSASFLSNFPPSDAQC